MFNGIWLVAAEPLTIQGREIKAGERFHLSRVHSGALLVTGRATILHPQPPPKSRVAEAPPPPPEAPPRRRKRTPKSEDVSVPAEASDTAEPQVIPEIVLDTPAPTDEIGAIEVPRHRYQRRDLNADES